MISVKKSAGYLFTPKSTAFYRTLFEQVYFFYFCPYFFGMKRKLIITAFLLCLLLTAFPACEIDTTSSIKTITSPYITQYECVEARLGDSDFLENFDYIRITLLDKKQLKVSYKPIDGKQNSFITEYNFNPETHELTAETGILGIKQTEKIIIENGKFTITKKLGLQQLILKFEAE